MLTADTIDVPPMTTVESASASASVLKRKASEAPAEAPDAKDRTSARIGRLRERMRSAPNWFPTAEGTTWTNVTRPGKSQRSLFVLTAPDGSQQFCMVGRVFSATLSEEALSVPSQYSDANSEHTDLQLHLSLRDSSCEAWENLTDDIVASRDRLAGIRESAIKDAMVPLILGDEEKLPGIPDKKLKAYRKKTAEQLTEVLEDSWGGTGTNEAGDIMRTKRRCYYTTDLSNANVFMDKWLSVTDASGQPINYIADNSAIERGDLVLVWFRALAQATAGNFHVSLEPRTIMRLERDGGGSGGGREGSAAFAAALVKAMQRDADI